MGMIYLGRFNEAELSYDGPLLFAASARALDDANQILAAARAEAELIRRRAQEEGYQEGISRGQSEIANMLAAAHLQANQHLREMEPVLVDCIIHAVRMLVGEAGAHRRIERAVLRVQEYLADLSGLILRVSPGSMDVATQAIANLTGEHGIAFPMRVVTDQALSDDVCILESPLGRAEVNLNEQIARLRSAVEQALSQMQAAS